jgi:hypothetical protein
MCILQMVVVEKNMNNSLKLIIKRQLLFMGVSLGIYFVVTYFFGFMAGFMVNLIVFLAVMFFIRRKQLTLRSFDLDNKRISGSNRFPRHEVNLKYSCLSCSAEVKGLECNKCGSKMKKPLF